MESNKETLGELGGSETIKETYWLHNAEESYQGSLATYRLALGRPCEGHAWRPLDNHRTLPYNSAMNLRFSCCYS
ncbi:conserved hypothetical protein [Ricinus communis]|uniref:Uncharacterized protein n=1 Tax=Ricinus communis TaxID=3988 RepID=B9SL22_RICCO|nr:conserved hypothetical protein [Ricinus communis]